jgi:branched-subunit amino acid aminotransferase/4-amino-4-deoxychorismate lyase
MNSAAERIELNGAPASVGDLAFLVQTNYGHFTSMPVRECRVRGLDLHLDRLVDATHELFGHKLDRDTLRAWLHQAIGADTRPLSVRVNVFSRALDRARMNNPAAPDVLVSVRAARTSAVMPVRLKPFRYQRDTATIKHVGTFPLFHYRRLAQQAGFDDALFVDGDGAICEASLWNIGLHDGSGIVWPEGPQLDGIGMQLLQAGLVRRGVSSSRRPVKIAEVTDFRAAFLTNTTTAVCPVARIDAVEIPVDETLIRLLVDCHESNPWDAV